jgi:hypothetical protein
MTFQNIKKYRSYLIVLVALLVAISAIYVYNTDAYLTKTDKVSFDGQIGRMNMEVKLNGNSPQTTWQEVPVAVKLIGGTKISSDEEFNNAVMPANLTFKNIDVIPFNMTFEVNMPQINDNGILYLVLPYDQDFPVDSDYKSFILQETGLESTNTYNEFKTALSSYNTTSIATYKSTVVNDKFNLDSRIIRLNQGETDRINMIFWAEYDNLNSMGKFENTASSDYEQINIDFSVKVSVRQIQDPIFIGN